jgi:iron complex outermembrane receptor protein
MSRLVSTPRRRRSTAIVGNVLLLASLSLAEQAFAEAAGPAEGGETPPVATEPAPAPEPKPAAAAPLPTVHVQAPRVPRKPRPSQQARVAPPRAQPSAPVSTPVPAAPTTAAGGPSGVERGTGPVHGYVAKQSVTATKTDTPILETPQSISVVTQDQIAAQEAQTLPQALRYTPGVITEPYGASSLSNDIKIRGFLAPRYLDGLRLPVDSVITFAQARIDPWGLERIEVLKGPSSGLYGETSPGGLLNMISKRPTVERQSQIELQTGSFDRAQAAFDFGGPIDADRTLLYRLVGLARKTDTVIDLTNERHAFIAPSFTWQPTGDTRFTILTSFQRDHGDGQPQQYLPAYGTLFPNINGQIPYDRNIGEPGFDHWQFKQDLIGYAFEHRFNDVFQFRQNVRSGNVTMYLTSMRNELAFPNMVTTLRSGNDIRSWAKTFGADNQVQADFATGPVLHKVLMGVDYQKQDSFAAYSFGFGFPINIYDPIYGIAVPNVNTFTPVISQTSDQYQTGFYAQDQIKLDRWILTLTGRQDHWAASTINYLASARIDQSSTANTGRAGLSYIFDNGVAPYVSYSTSFEPVVGISRLGAHGEVFKPTTGEGREVGVKYQPVGLNALFTTALFEITQQNVLTTDPVNPFFSIQTGAKMSLTDRLDLVGGFTHIEPIVTASTTGNVGKDVVNIPRDYAALWAKYTFREGPTAGLGFGGGVRYIGASFMDQLNTVKIPGYTVFDATLSYDLAYLNRDLTGLKLQVNATNIFDTYYVATCFTALPYCGLGAPRTVLATLKYAWNEGSRW